MDGCQGMLYGPAKRRANQLLMETISIHTLDLSGIGESAYKLHLSMMKAHDFASKVRYQRTRNSLILVHSSSSAFLHEHLLPHPVLHPHDTMHNIDFDATGLSLNVGINTPSLHCHPQSVGSKERPSYCCTV